MAIEEQGKRKTFYLSTPDILNKYLIKQIHEYILFFTHSLIGWPDTLLKLWAEAVFAKYLHINKITILTNLGPNPEYVFQFHCIGFCLEASVEKSVGHTPPGLLVSLLSWRRLHGNPCTLFLKAAPVKHKSVTNS